MSERTTKVNKSRPNKREREHQRQQLSKKTDDSLLQSETTDDALLQSEKTVLTGNSLLPGNALSTDGALLSENTGNDLMTDDGPDNALLIGNALLTPMTDDVLLQQVDANALSTGGTLLMTDDAPDNALLLGNALLTDLMNDDGLLQQEVDAIINEGKRLELAQLKRSDKPDKDDSPDWPWVQKLIRKVSDLQLDVEAVDERCDEICAKLKRLKNNRRRSC